MYLAHTMQKHDMEQALVEQNILKLTKGLKAWHVDQPLAGVWSTGCRKSTFMLESTPWRKRKMWLCN
jgi:hypothetical protein